MNIPFLSLKQANSEFEKEYFDNLKDFLENGNYILGAKVEEFESSFSTFCNQKYCVGLANGLDALILAIEAFDFPQDSEILVPANTYFASILAIIRAGMKPVLVEPSSIDFLLDYSQIESRITSKTVAILAVNLYGRMCDFDTLNGIKERHGLKLIVDAAQSHGALYLGNTKCLHADAIAYSFYPTKNLGALADAGALCTDNEDVYRNIKRKRNYGSEEKYVFDSIGINSRLSELQASFLLTKLKSLPLEIENR
ncbi:MAG: DegT/DnrJ/EryC1/StrS family aminotransferase, partial [Leadbetterella sp.]